MAASTPLSSLECSDQGSRPARVCEATDAEHVKERGCKSSGVVSELKNAQEPCPFSADEVKPSKGGSNASEADLSSDRTEEDTVSDPAESVVVVEEQEHEMSFQPSSASPNKDGEALRESDLTGLCHRAPRAKAKRRAQKRALSKGGGDVGGSQKMLRRSWKVEIAAADEKAEETEMRNKFTTFVWYHTKEDKGTKYSETAARLNTVYSALCWESQTLLASLFRNVVDLEQQMVRDMKTLEKELTPECREDLHAVFAGRVLTVNIEKKQKPVGHVVTRALRQFHVRRFRNHLRYVSTCTRVDAQRRAEGKEMVNLWNELPEELAAVVAGRFTEKVGGASANRKILKAIGLSWFQETVEQERKKGAAGAEVE